MEGKAFRMYNAEARSAFLPGKGTAQHLEILLVWWENTYLRSLRVLNIKASLAQGTENSSLAPTVDQQCEEPRIPIKSVQH